MNRSLARGLTGELQSTRGRVREGQTQAATQLVWNKWSQWYGQPAAQRDRQGLMRVQRRHHFCDLTPRFPKQTSGERMVSVFENRWRQGCITCLIRSAQPYDETVSIGCVGTRE